MIFSSSKRSAAAIVAAGAALAGFAQAGPAFGQAAPGRLFTDLEWRAIGPSNMMGRISAIDALNTDYRTVLIGSASGGVWKSTNAGVTFTPIFDRYGSQSIGEVAFFQANPDIIWVGTGEANNRNSVGWGDGIYKSTDGGETFTNMGLRDTYQIAEIAPHPTDPDIVYVAAVGNLWGYNGRRGLFKTSDGGETWVKLTNGLPDDGRTGATHVEMDPQDPDVLYVGMYHRLRRPWNMHSGGPNGGIFKSTDAGESWQELTNGLPTGPTGMIDIDIYREDPRTVVAYVEASDDLPRDLSVPGSGIYRSDDGGQSWRYLLRHTSRPYYHGQVRIDPSNDSLIYVVSREFAHSEDGGQTWQDGKGFSSGGGDDHDMWISPQNSEVIYSATDQGAHLTLGGDGHISFTNMDIGQYYSIGVDMRDPYWIYGGLQDNGGWGIPSNSRSSNGINIHHAVDVNGGDGFAMQVDPTDWRTVYTAVHVGYFGRIDMETRESTFISPTPQTTVNFDEYYDPEFAETQTDYTINPGEHWLGGQQPSRTINGSILPPQFRWNWNSPLVLSPINPRTIYVGSSHLFKSTDRGDTWRIISPDLTKNDPATRNSTTSGGLVKDVTGAENHNTIFTIGPSPSDDAIIWVGTDDGNVQVTRDGGTSWTDVTSNIPGLPDTIWVSQVTPSHFDEGTAYVAFDNHRMGDFAPYLFKTTDFGASWTDLAGDLPREIPGTVIYDVVEDFENPDLLFLGTEFGVYVTINGGESWTSLTKHRIGAQGGIETAGLGGRAQLERPVAAAATATHARNLVDARNAADGGPMAAANRATPSSGRVTPPARSVTPASGRVTPRSDRMTAGSGRPAGRAQEPAAVSMEGSLPPVAVKDLVIHPRDADLIAGTHGRSIWILDDITPLQQLSPEVLASDVHLFESRVATKWLNVTDDRMRTDVTFAGENPAEGAAIDFYLAAAPTDSVRIEIEDVFGGRTRSLTVAGHAGINRARWDLRFLPSAEEVAAYRTELQGMLDEVVTRVEQTDQVMLLREIGGDLLSEHYDPDVYEDVEYPSNEDPRALLLAHLQAIQAALEAATSHGDLNDVRENLLPFSTIVGDQAFFGFYGQELSPVVAAAGEYRVRLTVDGQTYTGTVTVRDDPLLGRGAGPVASGTRSGPSLER